MSEMILVELASREGVSLNTFVNVALGQAVGKKMGPSNFAV